jgi:hypothetical protein
MSSESISLLESSYVLTVLFRLLRLVLSSEAAEMAMAIALRAFVGGWGSKMSPPPADDTARFLGEGFPNGGEIMILALGCSGDVWKIRGADFDGEEIVSTRQFNK